MTIRLLPKSEIEKSKAQERQMEIAEGAKLAKQVDLLRKAKAEEEQNLTRFRLESMKSLKIEMEALMRERDALESEIVMLKADKLRLKS